MLNEEYMSATNTYRVEETNGLVGTARPTPVQEQGGDDCARATATSETMHDHYVVGVLAQPAEHLFHDLHE